MVPKKTLRKNTVENRLAGIERRFLDFEGELRNTRFEMLRLSNKISDQGSHLVRLEDKLITSFEKSFEKFRSDIYTLIDPIAGQLKTFNEEQNVHEGQHREVYDDVQSLKKIHPQGIHQTVVV